MLPCRSRSIFKIHYGLDFGIHLSQLGTVTPKVYDGRTANCTLNFLFVELEGKAIGGVEDPVTFGEISYQFLNQTMVIVRLQ